MTSLQRLALGGMILLATSKLGAEPADETQQVAEPQPALTKLEAGFERQLSGSVLVGRYTTSGAAPDPALNEERYTIRKVTKVAEKEDIWRFFVRIQYGKLDVTLPLDLEVKWAGDTPVITLTDLTIPALGTFSARVLIHGEQYAGTWRHGDAGGHLFGKVTRGIGDR